jgi:hypothetical protein
MSSGAHCTRSSNNGCSKAQIEFYVRRFCCWIWRASLLCLAVGGCVPLATPPKNRPTTGRPVFPFLRVLSRRQPAGLFVLARLPAGPGAVIYNERLGSGLQARELRAAIGALGKGGGYMESIAPRVARCSLSLPPSSQIPTGAP